MDSVGQTLQRARVEQGLDLETVAARTRINIRYLTAIEADDRKSLPSGFFYRSFVDQYARLLCVDTTELRAEVDRLLGEDEPLPLPGYENIVSKSVPSIKSPPRFGLGRVLGSVALFAAVVAGCSGVYVWWNRARVNVAAKPLASSHPNTPAAPAVNSHTAKPVSLASNQKLPEETPSLPESAPAPITPSEAASQPPVDPSYKVLLDLIAREETWLSVTSDGKKLFSGVLTAHQTKTLAGKDSATMKIGNAGGVEVRWNGKLLAPLGARGQVLVVVFRPDVYQIVPPAPREGD